MRRLGLRGRDDWGWGLPRPAFLRQAAAGLGTGIATMLPMSIAMLWLGIAAPRAAFDLPMLAVALADGLLTGLAVALIEESFFRGLMYRAIERESGFRAAAICTALVYSAVHFLARARVPADEVAWDSGLRLLGGALAHFANPWPVLDSFVSLLLVGLMLAAVRARTGAIAFGLGLHMGWVWVIKVTKSATRLEPDSAWSFLVGEFDGYTGWLVAGWAAILVALAWRRGWLAPRPAT